MLGLNFFRAPLKRPQLSFEASFPQEPLNVEAHKSMGTVRMESDFNFHPLRCAIH
jgi:hypothetical protein